MGQSIQCPVSFFCEEYEICLRLLWNDSTIKFVSCLACDILRFPTHHILAFCNQSSLKYRMKNPSLGKFVVSISISCSTQKIRSTSMGHPQEYIILPSANRMFDLSCGFIIFLMTFLAQAFRTCHTHNRTHASSQTFLCWNNHRK